tara:strand:+ start:375 stop:1358 length:984 start_codon:yes stop_codon:yes gene_type:complete
MTDIVEIVILLQSNLATILRIFIDACILVFAHRKARSAEATVAETFIHGDEVLSFFSPNKNSENALLQAKNIGFHIVTSAACEIERLRVGILLSTISQKISPYAYIDLEGSGAFDDLILQVPFVIQETSFSENNVMITRSSDRMRLLVSDLRHAPLSTDQFKISVSTPIMLRAHSDGVSTHIELPIRPQLRTVGQPWTRNDLFPNLGAKLGDYENLHFPAINQMEISISSLPSRYSFSATGLVPPPEFRSESDCRWISGKSAGARQHSSILCHLTEKGSAAEVETSRIRGGFSVGLWTAVFVTVAIDITWSSVDLIAAVLGQFGFVD